jgi:hypothetical protein
VTLDGKLTLPLSIPLAVIFTALPAEAFVSDTTLLPDGNTICSASIVETRGPWANDLNNIYPPTAAKIMTTIAK